MKVAFDGIGETVVTFESNTKLKKGVLVNIIDNGKVAIAKENDKFVGVVIESGEKEASVQIKGYVKLPYDGDIKNTDFGYCKVSTSGNGKLKINDKGKEVMLCEIDDVKKEIGIII